MAIAVPSGTCALTASIRSSRLGRSVALILATMATGGGARKAAGEVRAVIRSGGWFCMLVEAFPTPLLQRCKRTDRAQPSRSEHVLRSTQDRLGVFGKLRAAGLGGVRHARLIPRAVRPDGRGASAMSAPSSRPFVRNAVEPLGHQVKFRRSQRHVTVGDGLPQRSGASCRRLGCPSCA